MRFFYRKEYGQNHIEVRHKLPINTLKFLVVLLVIMSIMLVSEQQSRALATTPTPFSSATATFTATPTITPTPIVITVLANKRTVNLRSGPGTNYGVVATSKAGETFVVIAQFEGWFNVETDLVKTGRAWIAASVVEEVVDFATIVPTVLTVPAPPPTRVRPRPQPTTKPYGSGIIPPTDPMARENQDTGEGQARFWSVLIGALGFGVFLWSRRERRQSNPSAGFAGTD